MSGTGDGAEPEAPGRRAVLVIFGGIILVLTVASYFAVQLRAATRARMAPPAASSAPP